MSTCGGHVFSERESVHCRKAPHRAVVQTAGTGAPARTPAPLLSLPKPRFPWLSNGTNALRGWGGLNMIVLVCECVCTCACTLARKCSFVHSLVIHSFIHIIHSTRITYVPGTVLCSGNETMMRLLSLDSPQALGSWDTLGGTPKWGTRWPAGAACTKGMRLIQDRAVPRGAAWGGVLGWWGRRQEGRARP